MYGAQWKTIMDSLADYPAWFVVLCSVVVLAALLCIFAKLVKWLLYALIFLLLAGGLSCAAWLLFHG